MRAHKELVTYAADPHPEDGPGVLMAHEEAEQLASAIDGGVRFYRQAIERNAARVRRAGKSAIAAILQAELDALTAFLKAHCEAHGITGYGE